MCRIWISRTVDRLTEKNAGWYSKELLTTHGQEFTVPEFGLTGLIRPLRLIGGIILSHSSTPDDWFHRWRALRPFASELFYGDQQGEI